MNEVQVFFMGMVMWWLTAPGPFVLIPDLASHTYTHEAIIQAKPSAFVDGTCPRGFVIGGDGDCEFVINGAGATGGVSISLLPSSTQPLPASSFCMVPKVQRTTPYSLRREFTPPLGARNAAWMVATGGRAVSGMRGCSNMPPGNCPRFVRWSLPATTALPVKLILANLKNGAPPIETELKAGAQLRISNSPSLLHQHMRNRGASNAADDDWCAYFEMLDGPGGTHPHCPGGPAIPAPCHPVADEPALDGTAIETVRGDGSQYLFQTVACSNSQYP